MGQSVVLGATILELGTFFHSWCTFSDPALLHPPDPSIDRVGELAVGWQRRGYDLAVGIGIAQGYATLGAIGFEGRLDYGAIGTVTNLAARLCAEAAGGQVLVSQRVAAAVEGHAAVEPVGPLTLKGFARPVPAFAVGARGTTA